MNRASRFLSLLMILNTAVWLYSPADARQNAIPEDLQRLFDEFGDFPSEDIDREADHSYPYEFLDRHSVIRFTEDDAGIRAVIDHIVRLKFYSGDPADIADAALITIPFYQADDMEKIRNLEAVVHQPDGRRTTITRSDASRSQINSRYDVLELELPDLDEGVVVEYKYTVQRKYIEELPDFYFSHRVPTSSASVTLQNERFLRYEAIRENTDFSVEYIREEVDTSSIPKVFSYRRPEPILLERWRADSVPAVEAGEYVSALDDLRGKIRFIISEFGIPRQPLENSWELVAAQIRRNADPEELILQQEELKDAGKKISDEFSSRVSTQDSIYSLVNQTVVFNEMNAVFADNGIDHVMNGESANQAEINMVLISMLRGAGIDAYPVYISGRDFGKINRAFPSLYQFNRMLVHSKIDDRSFVMDASFPHSEPDLIPIESYNEQGFVLREDSYEWIDITPEKSVFDLTLFVDADLNDEGDLSGTIRANTAGYPARRIRSEAAAGRDAREIAASTLLDRYETDVVKEADIRLVSGNGRSVILELDFEIENYAVSFSDGMEYRPMVVGYLFQNPFESTSRRVPITLDAPEKLLINYTITIPDGFGLDGREGQQQIRLSGAELNEQYQMQGKDLLYSFQVDISRKEFPADMYNQLRRMYERWVELSNNTWLIENRRP